RRPTQPASREDEHGGEHQHAHPQPVRGERERGHRDLLQDQWRQTPDDGRRGDREDAGSASGLFGARGRRHPTTLPTRRLRPVTHSLLLDVSSLGYRSYFALRDAVHAPDGSSVGAVVGYLDMVTRLIVSRRPDEVVHVYDHDWRPTVRTELYPGYKANRPDEPEDLTVQFA